MGQRRVRAGAEDEALPLEMLIALGWLVLGRGTPTAQWGWLLNAGFGRVLGVCPFSCSCLSSAPFTLPWPRAAGDAAIPVLLLILVWNAAALHPFEAPQHRARLCAGAWSSF